MSNQDTQITMDNQSNLLESTVKIDSEKSSSSAPTNFDQIPIGGKKFDFSEYPAEGEELPKPKKATKKPPARFANKKNENSQQAPVSQNPQDLNEQPVNNSNNFDEVPIGGKKFDFSEFPQQGQQPKKPLKKPPARFAKKMEEAKNASETNQKDIPIKPAQDIDEIPIGGKKFDFSQFPEEGQQPKQPKKPVAKPKPKPKPVNNPPPMENPQPVSNIDEIPIGGGGKLDEMPIGKGNTFNMSEFPEEGEQAPVETNYTMSQKLKSKAVKLRLSGMQDLLALLENDENNPDLGEVEIGKLLKQTNPACLQKILQCLKVWIQKQKKWGDDQAKSAIENGFINGKPNTKKLTVQITDQMYQKSPDAVEMTLMVGLKGKVPKTLAGYIAMINELLAIYGMKRMKFMKPYMSDIVTILNRQKLVAVKTEGMNLLKQSYKWLSKEVVDPLLKDLKENLKAELDKFWEGHDKSQVMTAPKDIAEANDGKPKKKIDAYELSEAVDIFKKYNEKFAEQVLKEEKWSEKVKLMQQFVNAANVPKLAHTEYRHISQLTRRLINHSNFNVVLWTLKILAVLAKGLRRHFFTTVKSQFSNVLAKFRDKKTQMVEETFNTLNDFSYCISIEDVVEDVKEGLGDKAPNMKVNLINWIGKFVEKKVEQKDELPDKAGDAIRSLFPTFEKLLSDGVADVRDAMVKNIGKMKILIGEQFFAAMDKKMTKGQASKAEQVKKEMPKKASREKDKKETPAKSEIKGKGGKTIQNNSMIGNQSSAGINEEIQPLISKMNHSDWQKRKQSAQAIIEILSRNENSKVNLSCLGDLLNTLKSRIADPNKNIVKYFVQLTGLVFEIMSEKDVKHNAKNFMTALADGLSDKMQSNRVEISAALNKIGAIYSREILLTQLGSYLDGDKDSRVEILNLILQNEEYLLRADTRQYPKGIIKGLTDKNKQIRSLSQKLLQRILEKVNIDVFKNLSKNQRPAIAKDLNAIFSKYDNKNNDSKIMSRGASPPRVNIKQPPISAKKSSSQRSVSKGRKLAPQEDDDMERQMYSTIQPNSSFIKSQNRSFIEGNDYFAPLKILSAQKTQRQQNDERNPWICDMIKDSHEEELVDSLTCLFKEELSRKMMSMDHRKVNDACQQIIRLCKDITHQNEIREVYDLIFKWVFARLWGGSPAIQSIIEVLPPIMSILEKKRQAINDSEVDIVVAILREYFITGYMNEYKVSESLYTITKCLIALNSGDRLLRKLLYQFNIELTSMHRHIRKQATSFYRDGLSKLIKNQLMEYVGNGGTLEEASRIKQLKNDPQFVQLLYSRFHENVLDSFGFRSCQGTSQQQQAPNQVPPPQVHHPPHPPKRNEQPTYHQPVQNRRTPNTSMQEKPQSRNSSFTQHNNHHQQPQQQPQHQQPQHHQPQHHQPQHNQPQNPQQPQEETQHGDIEMDLSIYPMPHPASPLGKHLAKLLPPNDATVSFFNALLMESGQKISVQLTTYAKVIFGSILNSVEVILNNRNEHMPEKIINQINLLQQSIKCKYIINNVGQLLYFGTRFALLQLVYEDEHKSQILNDLHQRGIDFKVEQFIKVINGVMLRILENACPQETVNILLRMLNYHASMQYVSQKTTSLIIKCLSRVANNYSMEISEDRTKQFIMLVVEYFQIINLHFGLEQFNPSPDEKLKPEETIIKSIKNILTELGKHYGEQIWVHYDCAMSQSKYCDNHVGAYLSYMGIPYPDNAEQIAAPEDEELKKINELLSKAKTFDNGIAQLKIYIVKNPDFQPNQYFTSRGFDQKFIIMVLTALDSRKGKRTPTKRQIREERSQNARKPVQQNTSDSNIQDRIQKLKMKFDEIQPKPQEKPSLKPQAITTKAKDDDRGGDQRAAQIKRRIDEMKNRLNRN